MEQIPEFLKPEYYFSKENIEKYKELFEGIKYVWEALPRISEYVRKKTGSEGKKIILGEGTRISEGAVIEGPCVIGKNCQIRPGAYIRESVIIGDNCIVRGEMKNSLMMDNSAAAHWPYIGDSIIGEKVNLGARTTLSNLKVSPSNVKIPVSIDDTISKLDTGLKKFGAIIGDGVSTGCHTDMNPGTLVGKYVLTEGGVVIGPGCYPSNKILKKPESARKIEVIDRK